jgi:transcriptional regulator with XRE-family HTH domain
MKRFNYATAAAARKRAGKTLVDIAASANVSPATVRTFELGAATRPRIVERLQKAYEQVCTPTK